MPVLVLESLWLDILKGRYINVQLHCITLYCCCRLLQLTGRSSLKGNSQSTINSTMTAINRRSEDQSKNSFQLPAISSQKQLTINNASFSSFTSSSPRRAGFHAYKLLADFQSDILSGCLDNPRRPKETDKPKEREEEPIQSVHLLQKKAVRLSGVGKGVCGLQPPFGLGKENFFM